MKHYLVIGSLHGSDSPKMLTYSAESSASATDQFVEEITSNVGVFILDDLEKQSGQYLGVWIDGVFESLSPIESAE